MMYPLKDQRRDTVFDGNTLSDVTAVYVTVNLCNQGIREFPERFSKFTNSLKIFRELANSLNLSGISRIP